MNENGCLYFIGVSTGSSAALRMFPAWARLLGQPAMTLRGLDLPLDAPPQHYRQAVLAIRDQPEVRGALVTSHKLNLLRAAGDLFDELSEDAQRAREVSCLYKRGGRLLGHAVDPESTYRALQSALGPGYWRKRRAYLLCLGAGGTAAALLAGLLTRNPPGDLPEKFIFVDRSPQRLESLQALSERLPERAPLEWALHTSPEENDACLAQLPPGSLVLNATGMGKDLPGSPLTAAAVFPQDGVAWDLNYRGQLDFLRQARAQAHQRGLRVVDGWELFILGWALVCAAVFDIDPFGPVYPQLLEAANVIRFR
jgi:shikimate 5-dehydrogenase